MPRLSIWLVRASLLYLVIGFALGTAMLAARAMPAAAGALAELRPLHVELLTLGWIVNLGMGVGYWILPRHAAGAERGGSAAVVAAVLLNAGVLAVGAGAAIGAAPPVLVAGRAAEAGAAIAFALHAWTRVKPYGAGRPAPGGKGSVNDSS